MQSSVDELYLYTLSHGGPEFIHQHVVDAAGAQTATAQDKPIRLVFSLVGLYLHVERGFSGREVQLAHMKMARTRCDWPSLVIPTSRGPITAADVLATPLELRDAKIHDWCVEVWHAFAMHRSTIESLLAEFRITDPRSVAR